MQTVTGQQLLEQSYQAGHQEGRQEGRQEGCQEGQLRAKREDILMIVSVRFSSVPETLRARLEMTTTLDRLSDIFTTALTAATIDDVFRAVDET